MDVLVTVVVVIVVALVFDFTNGFHDTANAMATSVATEETPRSGTTPRAAALGVGVCFALCGAAVLYGIRLTIPRFH